MALAVDSLHGWGHAWWVMAGFGAVGIPLALALRQVERRRFG
jgi:hypothetical protein